MGIAANQARLMSLTARRSDLEYRAQQISATKMRISQVSQGYSTDYSAALNRYSAAKSLNPDGHYIEKNGTFIEAQPTAYDANGKPTAWETGAVMGEDIQATYDVNYLNLKEAEYDNNTAAIASQEKMYDLELTQVNTEHTAIKTEYDSIKSLIKDNVDKSFNIFG